MGTSCGQVGEGREERQVPKRGVSEPKCNDLGTNAGEEG